MLFFLAEIGAAIFGLGVLVFVILPLMGTVFMWICIGVGWLIWQPIKSIMEGFQFLHEGLARIGERVLPGFEMAGESFNKAWFKWMDKIWP